LRFRLFICHTVDFYQNGAQNLRCRLPQGLKFLVTKSRAMAEEISLTVY